MELEHRFNIQRLGGHVVVVDVDAVVVFVVVVVVIDANIVALVPVLFCFPSTLEAA
jgi:hypothetical protein